MRREITITAEPRDTRGKNEARRLRVRGLVPAIVYGTGNDPVAVAVSPERSYGNPEEPVGPQHDLRYRYSRREVAGHGRRLAA